MFSLALSLLVLWMLVYGIYLLATGQTDHGVFLIVIGGGGLVAVGGGALRVLGASREKGFWPALRSVLWPSPADQRMAPPSAPAQEPEAPERRKGRKRTPKKAK